MTIHTLWSQYPELQKDLKQTQITMDKAVKIRNKELTAVLEKFFSNGGKLLRPAFFLLFTHFGEQPSDKRKYQYAAALEILHAATLIHDDIIDESAIRRDMPSIQTMYGKDIAVYTGDFLFTVYFQLITQATGDIATLEMNQKNMRKILVGELDQMNLRFNVDITVKEYLRHIKGKTAQLFQLSCMEGARFAKAPKLVQLRAYRIGYNIGMAFQIIDDILDFSSSAEVLHKPVLEDLKNGNYTLPLIFAMEKNREAFSVLNKRDLLTAEDIELVVAQMTHYQGIETAIQLAKRYTRDALKEINKLPNIPEKYMLREITEQLLQREF